MMGEWEGEHGAGVTPLVSSSQLGIVMVVVISLIKVTIYYCWERL